MLILSRKQEESVVIGDNVVIKIISIDKGTVRLGFEAPDNMVILRSELKDIVEKENQEANTNKKANFNDEELKNLSKILEKK